MNTIGSHPPVTVIVPCFNEAPGLPTLLGRLRAMPEFSRAGGWGAVFVDDGSTDETFSALLRAARDESWLHVVRHHENLGLGAALRTGVAHADSPIICTVGGDCTLPPERLPELTALIEDGADIATASPWVPAGQEAPTTRFRHTLGQGLSHICRSLVGQDVQTFTCLFRAYRRSTLERIRFRANGSSALAEIVLKAMSFGFVVREVSMRLEPRRFGEPKLRVGDALVAHMHLLGLTAVAVGRRTFLPPISKRGVMKDKSGAIPS
ncbi:MAG TPA: glycosyltransferase family 2 protein [Candidatus Binatia bacterium]|nr:glycosyltransferase family 2 protein [Candidatus Binatia bacterium]